MTRPLILDFDNSVHAISGAERIALGDRQEAIRFGCSMAALRALGEDLPAAPPMVLLGSGDYHHVSYLLIERLRVRGTPVQVVVFDNHPDNMRYPFGIHCGSWVAHAARLPHVARIEVAGITSADVSGAHAIENRLRPLRSGKVRYWCIGRDLRALQRLGARRLRSFDSVDAMLDALL